MDRKDLTLLVIGAGGERGLSPVQLQKSVFLLTESGVPGLPANGYKFTAYNYGPFDADVYRDADALTAEGCVAKISLAGRSWKKYLITPTGETRFKYLETSTRAPFQQFCHETVTWVTSLSFNDLLRAIYAKYPAYRANSVFQG